MPGTEAQKAFDHINERFPGSEADGTSAKLVFVAPDGQKVTSATNRAAIDALVADGPSDHRSPTRRAPSIRRLSAKTSPRRTPPSPTR